MYSSRKASSCETLDASEDVMRSVFIAADPSEHLEPDGEPTASTGRADSSMIIDHLGTGSPAKPGRLRSAGMRATYFAAALLAITLFSDAAARAAAAWPPAGYTKWNANIAYRQITAGGCGILASHGCWKLLMIARHGCRGGLFITLNEFRGKVLVGDSIDSVDVLPAMTPARMEFDPDISVKSVVARIATVDCYSS